MTLWFALLEALETELVVEELMIILKLIHWCYWLSASAECRAGICIFVSFCQLRPIQPVQPLFLSIWLRALHQQRLEATTQHQVHPNTRCFSSLWPNSCHRRNRPGIRKSSRTLQVKDWIWTSCLPLDFKISFCRSSLHNPNSPCFTFVQGNGDAPHHQYQGPMVATLAVAMELSRRFFLPL